jgi:signal transduction histidine kinase
LLLRSTFKPVNDLVAATKTIIGGELDTFVPVRGDDAVAQLAKSFNELVNWVKQHRAQIDTANKMLEEANHELERKIEHRTLQLEASNGRLSNEIAEKEDFLRAISHDLNAPLRNIGGTVAMLMMKHKATFNPDMVEKLDRIKRNVEIQTDLINELLELSRIKTRRATMELVEMEAMIWDLRGLFDSDLKGKGIELVIDSTLPNLWAEKARVRQIFQNLIDNAIKYMGERPVKEIRVGCKVRVTEAEFYVKDTGSGIHPDDIEKVFFVFRRGKSEVAQKVAGKGVGLASVKSIIENYSGKIWVESQLAQGTTFFFTINGKHVPSVSGQSVEELKRLQQQKRAEEEAAPQEKIAA